MKFQLLGGTGSDKEFNNSQALTKNWYINKSNGKSGVVLYPTPGLTQVTNIGTGPIRESIEYGDIYYIVSGNEFYEVSAAGLGVLRGTLNTSIGRISMSHNGANNGQQIIIADGTQGYIWDTEFNTFAIIELKKSGTAYTNTLNKLEGSGGGFLFATSGIVAGMIVYNTTDGTNGIVSAIDSDTVLSIVNDRGTALDLFPLGTERKRGVE